MSEPYAEQIRKYDKKHRVAKKLMANMPDLDGYTVREAFEAGVWATLDLTLERDPRPGNPSTSIVKE